MSKNKPPDTSSKLPTFSSKLKHNIDIYVPDEIINLFPDITGILTNSDLEHDFVKPEELSTSNKFYFNALGITSLIFIITVLFLTTLRLGLVSVDIAFPGWLLWVSAILGILSFVIAGFSLYKRFQSKWLFNRFVTERIRQWKFQQFLDGELIELSKTAPTEFDKEIEKRWTSFKFDFVYKSGSLDNFVKAEDFSLFVTTKVSSPELMNQVFEAYFKLRLNYQSDYFSFKQIELKHLDELTKSIAKFSLLIAGLLALTEIAVLIINDLALESTLGWILGVSAISAAIISAATRVYRSSKAFSEETERYSSKWIVLKILCERFQNSNATPEDKLNVMIETERICIEELREFIRVFQKSDYLL